MKKYLFIMTPMLPFPPYKGGAVQNLVEQIVLYNEKNRKMLCTITSVFEEETDISYKNSEVLNIKIPSILLKIRDKQIKKISGICRMLIEKIYLIKIISYIREKKFDGIVFENTLSYGNAVKKYSKGSKLILHLHNDDITNQKNSKKKLEAYDKIICVSEYIKDCVKDKVNKEISVVYNGIDVKQFKRNQIDRENMRNKYNIKKNQKVLLFSGRIVKEKGVAELIKAINLINDDVVLVILGSKIYGKNVKDDYYNLINNLIKTSSKRIIMTGFVNYDEISKYYSMSDVGILPSLCEEALSLSVLEYMSAGLPIIISNSGGMKELYDSKCGYIIDKNEKFVENLSDAICKMINNENNYINFSNHVLEKSKNYDSKTYVKSMISELIK